MSAGAGCSTMLTLAVDILVSCPDLVTDEFIDTFLSFLSTVSDLAPGLATLAPLVTAGDSPTCLVLLLSTDFLSVLLTLADLVTVALVLLLVILPVLELTDTLLVLDMLGVLLTLGVLVDILGVLLTLGVLVVLLDLVLVGVLASLTGVLLATSAAFLVSLMLSCLLTGTSLGLVTVFLLAPNLVGVVVVLTSDLLLLLLVDVAAVVGPPTDLSWDN